MHNKILELGEIINDLIKEISSIEQAWINIRELNPDFEEVSEEEWKNKEARCWIHGATDLSEANALEEWLYRYAPTSQIEKSIALNHYNDWVDHIREDGVYADFQETSFRQPDGKNVSKEELLNQSLGNYIRLLANMVEKNGWGSKKNKLALNSFLAYLRCFNSKKEVAFIEHIFPEQKNLHYGRIIRKVRPQVQPISQGIATQIIKQLAFQCAYGRPNAQHNAGEALALIWLCLTASRIRFPRLLEDIHGIPSKAIIFSNSFPELSIPSIFGLQKIRISTRVSQFIQTIADIPSPKPRKTILQTPLPDLRKVLNKAIKKANLPSNLGEITFLTFLSSPYPCDENIR